MNCCCVDVRSWSIVLRGKDKEAQQVSGGLNLPSLACEAQLKAPVRWRIDAFSTLINSPALASLTAEFYCVGGKVLPGAPLVSFPIADVGAHGVGVYVRYLLMLPDEQLFVSITPTSWPWWARPMTNGVCQCGA